MAKEHELDSEHYGCWCCMEIDGLTKTDIHTDEVVCGECGEAGILTMTELLATVNAAYEAGVWHPYSVNGHDLSSDDDDYVDDNEEEKQDVADSYDDEEDDDDKNYNH